MCKAVYIWVNLVQTWKHIGFRFVKIWLLPAGSSIDYSMQRNIWGPSAKPTMKLKKKEWKRDEMSEKDEMKIKWKYMMPNLPTQQKIPKKNNW